jgi:hypothetical protein
MRRVNVHLAKTEDFEAELDRQLRLMAEDMQREAQRNPSRNFNQPPPGRHMSVIGWRGWPAALIVIFTLDKFSEYGNGQPDAWHLCLVFGDRTRVTDDIAERLVKAFFPEGDAKELPIPRVDLGRHWAKDVVITH